MTGEYKEIGSSIVKSVNMAVNKINDKILEIHVKDNASNPRDTFLAASELNKLGVKIVIGPIFQENLKLLSNFNEITFLSFTNKINNNPKNVISVGVNAISQINTIKKFQKNDEIKRSLFLVPNNSFKNEIDSAIIKTKINLKDKFIYDTDPTTHLTDWKSNKISSKKTKFTRWNKRLEDFEDDKYENQIENLKKGIPWEELILTQ